MVKRQNDDSKKEDLTAGAAGGKGPVNGDDSGIGRRSYLKMAGIAASSVLASSQASAANSGLPNAIVFDGTNTSEPTEYSFTVSDSVEAASVADNTNDEISGQTVQGTVNGSANAYVYSGTIQQLSNFGPGTVQFGNDPDNILPEPTHRIVIRSDSEISYEFTVDGDVTKIQDGSKDKAEGGNDQVTQNGDGTFTVSGYTGNGYGDGFRYQGDVVDFSPLEGPYTLIVDGEETNAYDLTGAEKPSGDELVITSSTEVSYQFKTDAEPKKIQDGSRNKTESGNDSVTGNGDGTWTVSGYTGNGYGDSYELHGEVLEFSPMTGSYSLFLNGEETTAYDLTGTEPPETDASGSALGGGEGYGNTVPLSDADYTVTSSSELRSALSSASSGDVVYVTEDIYMSDDFQLPSGVTLASDRGINGSPGKRVYTDKEISFIHAQSGSRVTGLRISGEQDYLINSTSRSGPSDSYPEGWGIDVEGSNVEIDNCEMYYFGQAAIRTTGSDPHIHHCDIHHCQRDGLGYGVDCNGGAHPRIEYCRFNYNRHSLACASDSSGYTVENCWFGPDTLQHVMDHHGPTSSTELIIRNCTVEATHNVDHPDYWDPNTPSEALRIRGDGKAGRTLVENCWFHHPNEPSAPGDSGEAIYMYGSGSNWSDKNATVRNNHFGSDEPDPSIGHPRS